MLGLRYREDLQTGQTSIKEYISIFSKANGRSKLTVLIPAVDPILGRHGGDS